MTTHRQAYIALLELHVWGADQSADMHLCVVGALLDDCTPLQDGPRGTGALAVAGAVARAVAVSDFTGLSAWVGLSAGALSVAVGPFLQEWSRSAIRATRECRHTVVVAISTHLRGLLRGMPSCCKMHSMPGLHPSMLAVASAVISVVTLVLLLTTLADLRRLSSAGDPSRQPPNLTTLLCTGPHARVGMRSSQSWCAT